MPQLIVMISRSPSSRSAHDRRNVALEYCPGWFERGSAIVRDAEEPRHYVPVLVERVGVAHRWIRIGHLLPEPAI
jgi:hypothetical protein